MREVIVLSLGQCGNHLGVEFWESITQDHNISLNGDCREASEIQKERLNVYFNEVNGERFVPRSIFMDLDPCSRDAVQGGCFGQLFHPDFFIYGKYSAGNNYAKGYYGEGNQHLEQFMDIVRSQVEACDYFQGFQMMHSLGGGTGSGFGSLLLNKLQDEYPDRITQTFSIIPSPNVSDIVIEPYNTVLSSISLIDNASQCLIFDNEALYDISIRQKGLKFVTYQDMNKLVSFIMNGVTASFRFPGQLNTDLRKIGSNLIPFPRLHFFMTSFAPLYTWKNKDYKQLTIPNLVHEMCNPANIMCSGNPKHGRYLTGATLFRGKISSQEVDQQVLNLLNKTFLHWYTMEGMDEMEFIEAQSNINDLISQYITFGDWDYDEEIEQLEE